jgi:hypothetical protein
VLALHAGTAVGGAGRATGGRRWGEIIGSRDLGTERRDNCWTMRGGGGWIARGVERGVLSYAARLVAGVFTWGCETA